MTSVQQLACRWNDGTIIGVSPIVTGNLREPSRIVLRDLGSEFSVHLQYWPMSTISQRVVVPCYSDGRYFPKDVNESTWLAWSCLARRYKTLCGRDDDAIAAQIHANDLVPDEDEMLDDIEAGDADEGSA